MTGQFPQQLPSTDSAEEFVENIRKGQADLEEGRVQETDTILKRARNRYLRLRSKC